MAETEDSALAFATEILEQPAQLTRDQATAIEARAAEQCQAEGITRRLALALLALSMPDLMQPLRRPEDQTLAVGFADQAAQVREYAERLESLADLMRTAATRMDIALCCRSDYREVIAAAEGQRAAHLH